MESAPSENSSPAANARHCPDCGYSLYGLDPKTRCPECAFSYEPELIVLYGWGVGRYASSANSRPKNVAWMIIWSFAWLIPFLNHASVWGYGVGGLVLVPIAWGFIRRWQAVESPAPVQLRFSNRGWSVRLGYGPVELLPWTAAKLVHIFFVGGGRYRIEIVRPRVIGWPSMGTRFIEVEIEGDAEAAAIVRRTVNGWKEMLPSA